MAESQISAHAKTETGDVFRHGFAIIDKQVIFSASLTPEAKAIYIAYAAFANRDAAYSLAPREDALLAYLGMTHPTFLKHRRLLTDAGLMKLTQPRAKRDGGTGRVVYLRNNFSLHDFTNKKRTCKKEGRFHVEGEFGMMPKRVIYEAGISAQAKALYGLFVCTFPAPTSIDTRITLPMEHLTTLMSAKRVRGALTELYEHGYVCRMQNKHGRFALSTFVLHASKGIMSTVFAGYELRNIGRNLTAQKLPSCINTSNANNNTLSIIKENKASKKDDSRKQKRSVWDVNSVLEKLRSSNADNMDKLKSITTEECAVIESRIKKQEGIHDYFAYASAALYNHAENKSKRVKEYKNSNENIAIRKEEIKKCNKRGINDNIKGRTYSNKDIENIRNAANVLMRE